MSHTTLTPKADPMGAAIHDFYHTGKAARLRVLSSQFDEDEIPVETLFREFAQMPPLEQKALLLSQGRILDVGAGSGCHSKALQEMGREVVAIDISPLSVEVMRQRGIDAHEVNLYDENWCETFDTILLLMNGSGIIGKLQRSKAFFDRLRTLLRPGGSVLMDSSDLSFLYGEEDDDSSTPTMPPHHPDDTSEYYGEVDFMMKYKNIRGERFDWLYIDFQTLKLHAETYGWKAELVEQGGHYDYLARLTPCDEVMKTC